MSLRDLSIDDDAPAYYAGVRGDGALPVVEFRYIPAGVDPAASGAEKSVVVDRAAGEHEPGWDDMEGVQSTAQAVLTHYLGEEPDQAALEALVMDVGTDWTANEEWTLSVTKLRETI